MNDSDVAEVQSPPAKKFKQADITDLVKPKGFDLQMKSRSRLFNVCSNYFSWYL